MSEFVNRPIIKNNDIFQKRWVKRPAASMQPVLFALFLVFLMQQLVRTLAETRIIHRVDDGVALAALEHRAAVDLVLHKPCAMWI